MLEAVVETPVARSASGGIALDHRNDGGSHADEHNAEQQQEQAAGKELTAAESSAHDGEFAHETARTGASR